MDKPLTECLRSPEEASQMLDWMCLAMFQDEYPEAYVAEKVAYQFELDYLFLPIP